ncbi:MAG: biopolymer transporter ExbD [Candidatus Nitronauta litoralis]|uniref:Biopolymer transporter ExbD n=1 Tax=Candidatus Nitronauta litoralis TaxID=2705533 RepID=A0A7T0BW52_9BACT|nr:MAG: biopolymer transporter ExbD [Candidatus Nitronauta litoralis]
MVQIQSERKKSFRMDMAPLIDVVFLLLIFFMLTFSVLGQAMDVNLPDGEAQPEANLQEDINIMIDRDGLIRINGEPIKITDLRQELKTRLDARKDKLVSLETFDSTKFEMFTSVLDISRQAGAKDFNIIR